MTEVVSETVAGTPRLRVDRSGDSGPLVIFLHGIGGRRSNWTQQLLALADDFTAVAWDARGYGDSDDYDSELDFGDFSDDLLRVLAHCGADQCHLVGLSMGGRIALDFYGRHPARVKSLVLADTSVNSGDAVDPAKIEEFLALRLAPLQNGKEPEDIAPQVVESLVGLNTPPEVRQVLQHSLATLHKQSYMKTLACVTRYHGFPAFNAVSVPTLVLAGREDKIARPEIVEAMAAGIAGSELVWIEHAGHVSNVEQPAAFNAALLDFLARH